MKAVFRLDGGVTVATQTQRRYVLIRATRADATVELRSDNLALIGKERGSKLVRPGVTWYLGDTETEQARPFTGRSDVAAVAAALAFRGIAPTHVVVDTRDGYIFRSGSDAVLFTAVTAREFAADRNEDMPPAYRHTYRVFTLTLTD